MTNRDKNRTATYSNINTFLYFSRGESRGQDTYGYPIIRLRDGHCGEVFKCMGGGYDMHGTNLANWLKSVIDDQPAALEALATFVYNELHGKQGIPYGLSTRNSEKCKDKEGNFVAKKVRKAIKDKQFYMDGACGESCIKRIASGMGITIKDEYERAKTRKGTDKFIGCRIEVEPEGLLVRYLIKERKDAEAAA